jgi:hypothetical protein
LLLYMPNTNIAHYFWLNLAEREKGKYLND